MTIAHNDELIDVVNEHDEVVAVHWRSQADDMRYKRAAIAFLVNSEGKFCFLRRAAHKKDWCSLLSIPGGGVQSGESYEIAVKREILEEINLDMNNYQHRLLGILKPNATSGIFFKGLYEIIVDHEAINFNLDDFSEYCWLTPVELIERVAQGEKIADDLIENIERYYSHLLIK